MAKAKSVSSLLPCTRQIFKNIYSEPLLQKKNCQSKQRIFLLQTPLPTHPTYMLRVRSYKRFLPQVGNVHCCTVPFSVQKWIISRRPCAMLLNISSEKSKVTRELALVELSLACLMVTWKFYDGSSKRITILSILVRSDQLLSAICFCIPSYVHQQLHLLNFQNRAHAIL